MCQADGCGHAVYKRIHVVQVGDQLQVLGSECFKRLFGHLESARQSPRYGDGEGRRLSAEERRAMLENTSRLIALLEQEYRRAEEVKRRQVVVVPALKSTGLFHPRARWAGIGLRNAQPVDRVKNEIDPSLMAAARKLALQKLAAENPGVDLTAPGWSGLVGMKARELIRQGAVTLPEGKDIQPGTTTGDG